MLLCQGPAAQPAVPAVISRGFHHLNPPDFSLNSGTVQSSECPTLSPAGCLQGGFFAVVTRKNLFSASRLIIWPVKHLSWLCQRAGQEVERYSRAALLVSIFLNSHHFCCKQWIQLRAWMHLLLTEWNSHHFLNPHSIPTLSKRILSKELEADLMQAAQVEKDSLVLVDI